MYVNFTKKCHINRVKDNTMVGLDLWDYAEALLWKKKGSKTKFSDLPNVF